MENQNLNEKNNKTEVSPSGLRGINWGTSIVIAIALFMAFILYFVIKVQSNSKYDNELVIEEYYKHDARFGEEMIRIQNAHDLVHKPVIVNDSKGITITFPAVFRPEKITGNVNFYRSSNKKFDFTVPLSLSESHILIAKKRLLGGRWEINMEWQYDGKPYLTKETFYVN